MAFFGISRERWPIAVVMVLVLAVLLSWLQGRFDQSDVRKAISLAMAHREKPDGGTVFDAIAARGQGDPRCDGKIVSQLLGDVEVRCSTPSGVEYDFRVLLDRKRPPRPANDAAKQLVDSMR